MFRGGCRPPGPPGPPRERWGLPSGHPPLRVWGGKGAAAPEFVGGELTSGTKLKIDIEKGIIFHSQVRLTPGPDIFLSIVMFLFLLELILLSLVDTSYPFSFFFFMDSARRLPCLFFVGA